MVTYLYIDAFQMLFSPTLRSIFVLPHTELMFLETSALTGENVEEGFLKCARTILNKIDSGTHCFLFYRSVSEVDVFC